MVIKFIVTLSEDDIERKSFTVISIDSLLLYENKYYLKVYLDSCAYKLKKKDITIITVKKVDYCCIIDNITKFKRITSLKNSVLEDRGYIYKNYLSFQST